MNDELIKELREINKELRIKNDNLLNMLKDFCKRVEKGEVRSRKTYAAFKQAIEQNK